MSNKNIVYLSIDKFSKLTGVTKERLRFYDKENILKPSYKDINTGYRYYLPEQIYYMSVIIILVRFNAYTLDEIREILNNECTGFSQILKIQKPALAQKLQSAQKKEQYLVNSIEHNDYFSQFEYNTPYIVDFFYPPSLVTKLDKPVPAFSKEAIDKFVTHTVNSLNADNITIIPFSMRINSEQFYNGTYYINAYYTLKFVISPKEPFKNITMKKSILYTFNGQLGNIKNVLDGLHQYMADNNIYVKNYEHIHISVMALNFKNPQNTNCNIRIAIPITDAAPDKIPGKFSPLHENPFIEKKDENLYSSGNFAKLCGITKETLRFYNKNNLLLPCKITENGYKYYCNDQFGYFYFIKMLQKSGTTIKEIQELLVNENITQSEILKHCLNRHKLLTSRIAHYYKMTKAILDIRENLPHEASKSEIFVVDYPVIPHNYTYSKTKMDIYDEKSVLNMTTHITRYNRTRTDNKIINFPLALAMEPEDFTSGTFMLCGHSVFDFENYKSLDELPKQRYVCLHKELQYRNLPEYLETIRKYVLEANYKVTGTVRIIVTLENFKKAAENIYLMYIYIPIE